MHSLAESLTIRILPFIRPRACPVLITTLFIVVSRTACVTERVLTIVIASFIGGEYTVKKRNCQVFMIKG